MKVLRQSETEMNEDLLDPELLSFYMLVAITGPTIWQKNGPRIYGFLSSSCDVFVKIILNQGFR
jgi:hypothetical protein